MVVNEQALTFECEGDTLLGILHATPTPARRGVLIVVGGPQYRVGSHRQFTKLARDLASHGVPVFRFDCRGMGDSTGAARTFESVGADIRSAIDCFFERVPAMAEVVLWGLCDAASAALFYAHQDARVSGIALLNPWVHTERSTARAYLRHYYAKRLFDPGLWRKIGRGEFSVRRAAASLGRYATAAIGRGPAARREGGNGVTAGGAAVDPGPLPDRMEDGLRRFRGRVLLILSGNDLVAQEFRGLVEGASRWRALLEDDRVTRHDLPEANHTFARREWWDRVACWTEAWLGSA